MILLDTNVISELMKKPADAKVANWFIANDDQTVLCAPALAEIAFGIARLPAGKRRHELEEKLADVRIRYANRTVSFTVSSAMIYGDIMFEALGAKHNMSIIDAQIAAIANEHGFVLATRNIKDFEHVSVELADPWAAS